MGEYADMEIDRAMGLDDLDWLFGGGRPRRRSQTCNCCHQPVHFNARGQKMSGGVLHRCPMPKPGRLTLDDLVDGT